MYFEFIRHLRVSLVNFSVVLCFESGLHGLLLSHWLAMYS
jgi:hypothetical protein